MSLPSNMQQGERQRPQVIPWMRVIQQGIAVLRNPKFNKGTAWTKEERVQLNLHGLLPARVMSLQQQVEQVLHNLRNRHSDIERYVYFMGILEQNEKLFYTVLVNNISNLMPVVYTPTVGVACQKFGYIFQQPRGLWISAEDRGRVLRILENWPEKEVQAIVMTDGERILGLGDLGACGMGIPIGKLALYTACAGLKPNKLLPVMIDVGSNNKELREDEMYIGLQRERVRGEEYDHLIEELMWAVAQRWPSCMIQFEDFGNANAGRLLEKFRHDYCTFNDDIQGTASVALAGLYASLRITKQTLKQQKVLIFGAGSAGLGIAHLIAKAMAMDDGVTMEEARARIWLVDSRGLLVKDRSTGGVIATKAPFAHAHEEMTDLETIVHSIQPNVLIGVAAQPRVFTTGVLKAMHSHHDRPLVFPMSNPTSKAECTAQEAYDATNGSCVFASGSPFPSLVVNGKKLVPAQGNNAYIFPGVALGVVSTKATRIPEEVFIVAAKKLASMVSQESLDDGTIYPPLTQLRQVSVAIGETVAEHLFERNMARVVRPLCMSDLLEKNMYAHQEHAQFADHSFKDIPTATS